MTDARTHTALPRGFRWHAAALAVLWGVAGVVLAAPTSARAEDPVFPTWAEVSAARNNEAAQQALVDQITASLAGLQATADAAMAEADRRGIAYQEADQKFQEQADRTATLQQQAEEAKAQAARSEAIAGQLFAQMYRAGNEDLTISLFSSGDPESLLDRLGSMQQVGEQSGRVYEKALLDRNSAQSQADAAEVAAGILEEYQKAAQDAFAKAQEASLAATAALEAATAAKAEADAKLAVLTQNREATEADYIAGVIARTGSGASLGAGEISLSGWAKPVDGWITDNFGWRVHPIYGDWRLHTGTDIAAACGTPIYAAASGTVTYAGPNGSFGNFVEIDHGGITTSYSHTQWGAILVSVGQWVEVGQQISSVGATGNVTGCHLHLETRRGGVAEDAAAWFSSQGITLG